MPGRGALIALLLSAAAVAAPRTPPVGPPQGHVTDLGGVLPVAVRNELEASLRQIARGTGIEMAVLTVPSLGDLTVEEYAQGVFDAWKIGKKGDDRGALLLVALAQRKVRVQVGYGLEGVLPDGKVGTILDTHLVPAFRQGDITGGIVAGTRAVLEAAGAPAAMLPGSTAPRLARSPRGRTVSPEPSTLEWVVERIFWGFLLVGLAWFVLRHPDLAALILMQALLEGSSGSSSRHGGFGSFGGGGGFGGFGGGSSGGGGASRGW